MIFGDDESDDSSDSSDSYTETSSQGWFSRITESIKSVGTGIILFLISFVVLFWNEGRTVKTARDLKEGRSATVEAKAEKIESGNEGKLVHVVGEATVEKNVTDKEFDIKTKALILKREVEMYQWVEEKSTKKEKKLGGSEVTKTTYTYKKEWSSLERDSDNFKKKKGHTNPPMQFKSETMVNSSASLGAYKISKDFLSSLSGGGEAYSLTKDDIKGIKEAAKKDVHGEGDTVYIGKTPDDPKVGDYKISFKVVPPGTVSVIAKQVGSTFESYIGSSGTSISMIKLGSHSMDNMFKEAESGNKMMGWILRLLGFILMAAGLYMIFNPLVVVADVVPFLGSLLGLGIGVFAGIVAFALSLITIAIAWLFYRPILAIILIAIGVGGFVGLKVLASKKKAA